MAKISLREASRRFAVSRATPNKHLAKGKISGVQGSAVHWCMDTAEWMPVYSLRVTIGRAKPDQLGRLGPDPRAELDHDISTRLAMAEAALDAERDKTAMLQRHLDDVRRMLPPPDDARPRRRWWPL